MRAPFLLYYFPTIKWLGQINGIIFMDVGAAWNKDSKILKITDSKSWLDRESGGSEQGWVMSFGWGPRLILFGLPIQLNYAWQYNPISGKQSSRRYEITMGFDL
jgi:outer membrane protein assembly factor BamA